MRQVPTLPSRSPDPAARRAALEEQRQAYVYDTSYEGMLFLRSLPHAESFPPGYLAKGAEIALRLHANRAASTVGGWTAAEALRIGDALRAVFAGGGHGALREAHGLVGQGPGAGGGRGASTERFETMFELLPPPLTLAAWREDWCFAWQRLAGPTPNLLARVERLPPQLPITDGDLSRALGRDAAIAPLLARGRLFLADYSMFQGAPAGATDGAAKHLWAPTVLFAADPGLRGGLGPVAIQVEGARGGARTLYTPADPDWMAARTAAQIADENLQGVIVHLGWCHMIVQRFIVAAHRQLAAEHPLMALFAPHFELTVAVNDYARHAVVSPGGVQDRLLAPTLEAQIALLEASLRTLDLASLDPTVDFARRGVDDAEALPVYPFRDDSLPVWRAIRSFVDAYVRLYYQSDGDVASDLELAAFVREIGAPDGGRLPELVRGIAPARVDDVVDLAARVIFRATAYHAAINDSNYDWAGFVPGVPTAGFGPLPARGTAADDASLALMLPSLELGWETIAATYQVRELATNRLGDYPPFADPRVEPLAQALRDRLAAIEREITTRNAGRPLPYSYLLPSRITASINA